MSSYLHIALKGHKEFVEIGCFSRSHSVYQALDEYAAYGAMTPISRANLNYVIDDLEATQVSNEGYLREAEADLAMIPTFNNSVEEKTEAVRECRERIRDCKDAMEQCAMTIRYLHGLRWTMDVAEDSKYYEDENRHNDPDNYIWLGVECDLPTIEDGVVKQEVVDGWGN